MAGMSKEIAGDAAAIRAWKARWTAVNEFQDAELRNLSVAERFRQIESLFGLAAALGKADDLEGDRVVRERWMNLRHALRGTA